MVSLLASLKVCEALHPIRTYNTLAYVLLSNKFLYTYKISSRLWRHGLAALDTHANKKKLLW
jgi:hypothetical protein